MRILVLADTHIPVASSDIPPQIYKCIEGVDLILHAGDIAEKAFFEKLSSFKEIKAVKGNMDTDALMGILPAKRVINIGKFKIGLIHGWGNSANLLHCLRNEFENVDSIVFGHTHSSVNFVKDGVLFFNPGSPTDKIFATANSYGILEINESIKGEIITL